MRHWLLVPLLAVLAVEWWLSRRRRGVGRGQWRRCLVVRVGIAALLVAALLGPRARPAGRPGGHRLPPRRLGVARRGRGGPRPPRSSASRSATCRPAPWPGWCPSAVTPTPSWWCSRTRIFDQASTSIDANRTNLASALRVGAGMLPADARRRLVIVSDGRANSGDADAEVERLRRAGHRGGVPRRRPTRPEADLAVASRRGPGRACGPASEFELEVTVDADQAAPDRSSPRCSTARWSTSGSSSSPPAAPWCGSPRRPGPRPRPLPGPGQRHRQRRRRERRRLRRRAGRRRRVGAGGRGHRRQRRPCWPRRWRPRPRGRRRRRPRRCQASTGSPPTRRWSSSTCDAR